jgi:CheY-specific phosphatase CheX
MVEALNAFVASAISTLRETMRVNATVDCTVSPSGPRPRLVVDVGVTGDLRSVTWVFPVEIARELARQMVGSEGEEVEGFAAMELANVLTGRAVVSFATRGMNIEIQPPELKSAVEPGVRARLLTELGSIEIVFHEAAA